MNPTDWKEFKERAGRNGMLIEDAIKDVYTTNLDPAGNALDGGAHVGFHTLPLLARLTAGKVIAVEANRSTFARLKSNAQAAKNAILVHAALQEDERRSTISFHCSSSHPGRSGVGRLWDVITPGKVAYNEPDTVAATTIDKLVREHRLTRLDFMKLDLEGGEYNALRGAGQTLSEHRPLVVTEHSSHAAKLNHYAMEDYFQMIAAWDYTPIAPSGRVVVAADPTPFWYVFLVPNERLTDWTARIGQSMQRTLRAAA